MKVDVKKLVTSRKYGFAALMELEDKYKVGFAVLVVLVVYVGTFSIPSRKHISGFEGAASRNTPFHKSWSTTAVRNETSSRTNLKQAITTGKMAKSTSTNSIITTNNNTATTITTKNNNNNNNNSQSHNSNKNNTIVTKATLNNYKTFTTIQHKTQNPNLTTHHTSPNKTENTTLTKQTTKKSSVPYEIVKLTTVRRRSTMTPKHFICLRTMGRLGNLMFQYASTYGIARSKGMDVIVSSKESLVEIFHLHLGSRILADTSMCNGVTPKWEIRASAFDKETMNFDSNENIALPNYLQSYKYFENVADELRRQFKFRDPIQNKADQVIRDIFKRHLENERNKNRTWTFVSIHVRRGDMVNHPHGYKVAPREYFNRTQNMFRSLYKNVLFIVCSNDLKWCKGNLQTENTYFVEGNSAEVDMAVIASCNHTITSVGSYSWWSGWLSKGLVTYFFPPAREGSALRTQYSKDYKDYFLPKWIRVTL